jgi:hypothetical protein
VKLTTMKSIILTKKSKNLRKMKIKLIEMIFICKVLWILWILMKFHNKVYPQLMTHQKICWINKRYKISLWIFLETLIVLKMIYANLCTECKRIFMGMKIMKPKVLMLIRLKILAAMLLVALLFLWIKMILKKMSINNLQSKSKFKTNFKRIIKTQYENKHLNYKAKSCN